MSAQRVVPAAAAGEVEASAPRARARRSIRRALAAGLILAAMPVGAQSGRSWMSGLVFADSDTRGLAGATVELFGDPESERLRSVHVVATTSAAGKYDIERVPYGRYELRIAAPGFEPYSIPLYLASDALTSLHARLRRTGAEPIGAPVEKGEVP